MTSGRSLTWVSLRRPISMSAQYQCANKQTVSNRAGVATGTDERRRLARATPPFRFALRKLT
jgi:hypothetical protein